MLRCTACRASLSESRICPRCGCDFTFAVCAEIQTQRLICQAVQAWYEGNAAAAATRIAKARASKNGHLVESVSKMLRKRKPDAPEKNTKPLSFDFMNWLERSEDRTVDTPPLSYSLRGRI